MPLKVKLFAEKIVITCPTHWTEQEMIEATNILEGEVENAMDTAKSLIRRAIEEKLPVHLREGIEVNA